MNFLFKNQMKSNQMKQLMKFKYNNNYKNNIMNKLKWYIYQIQKIFYSYDNRSHYQVI